MSWTSRFVYKLMNCLVASQSAQRPVVRYEIRAICGPAQIVTMDEPLGEYMVKWSAEGKSG